MSETSVDVQAILNVIGKLRYFPKEGEHFILEGTNLRAAQLRNVYLEKTGTHRDKLSTGWT